MGTLLLGALILGGLWLASQKKGGAALPAGQQPVWTPDAKAAVSRLMRTASGATVYVFTPTTQDRIVADLQGRSLAHQGGAGGTTSVYAVIGGSSFPVVPAIAAARQGGQVVLGSWSLALPDSASRLISTTTRSLGEILAAPGADNGWAVLMSPDGWLVGEAPPLGPSLPGGGGGGLVVPEIDPPGGVYPETPADLDIGLTAKLRSTVLAALADPDARPTDLDALSLVCEQGGFPRAAAALQARAKALRTEQAALDAARGGTPYVIREGDIASNIAKHYAGDAGAWRKLPAINAGMSVIKKGQWEALKPWQVAQEILLPIAWKARSKPLPPLAGGGGLPDSIKPDWSHWLPSGLEIGPPKAEYDKLLLELTKPLTY